ncbi:hypothetical protein ACOMHN_047693 [Nucella lapillus]
MTRFSRLKQTFLFTTFCFMSYLGLLCQVQVSLPTNQKQSDKEVHRLLDYQKTSTAQTDNAEDGSQEKAGKTETESFSGGGSMLDKTSTQDNTFHKPDRKEIGGWPNNKTGENSTRTGSDTAMAVQTYKSASSQIPATAHRSVDFTPVGSMYVYAAHLDLRQKGNATARIFVLRHKKDQNHLVCFFIGDRGKNYTLYAQPYRMCENHGKEYEGWIYSYTLPSNLQTLPGEISVASYNQKYVQHKRVALKLKVIPPRAQPHAENIGVCVPPLFGHLTLASIINFIQMCKVLGAGRVFMYVGAASSEIKKFLTYHSQKDASLSVIDWNLPGNVTASRDKVWYHGQLLAIQDCLYHNMAAFRFLLFMDLDEMLVPRQSNTWQDMLSKMVTQQNKHSVAALTFKSAFFDPARLPQESENIVYFQHLHRTASTSRVRHKLMVQPMMVFELGIHHLSKGFSEECKSVEVSEKVALLHHYRVCEERYETHVKCDLVVEDRRMLRYKHRLTHLSHRAITDASRLFA